MRAGVVGAGLAGLMAARTLRDAGHDVVVFDKGPSPGGRLATRRIGGARVDHGAQFFTVRDETFERLVARWRDDGLVYEWCRGFDREDGYPRYAVRGGMNALAKHLASGLDVRCRSLVFRTGRSPAGGWRIGLDDATSVDVDALVMTCPLPQTYSLLFTSEVQMPDLLWRTEYDRTLALLVVLDGPSAVPTPGGMQGPPRGDPVFNFIGDNQQKGISDLPALTFHASAAWSDEHWDDPPEVAHQALLDLARPWFGASGVVEAQHKRWRFATPRSIWPEPCWTPDHVGSVAVAGDAFAGPKVEGAALSGIAAAHALLG